MGTTKWVDPVNAALERLLTVRPDNRGKDLFLPEYRQKVRHILDTLAMDDPRRLEEAAAFAFWGRGYLLIGEEMHYLDEKEMALWKGLFDQLVAPLKEYAGENPDESVSFYIRSVLLYRESLTEESFREVKRLMQTAAERGLLSAQKDLAFLCRRGNAEEGRIRWLTAAAEQGDPESAMDLATHYRFAPTEDKEKHIVWLRRAAELGHPGAMWSMADLGLSEDDDGVSPEEGFRWAKEAEAAGADDIASVLAEYYRQGRGTGPDEALAAQYRKKSAEEGDPHSMFLVAVDYLTGTKYFPKNEKEAFRLAKLAEAEGLPEAALLLAKLYRHGIGVRANPRQAFQVLKRNVPSVYPELEYQMAFYYEEGWGTKKDLRQAFRLFRELAQKGFLKAKFHLAYALEHGRGTKPDMAQAVQWYREAAEEGNPASQNALGILLLRGIGVGRNPEEGVGWLEKAAAQGTEDAIRSLATIYAEGREVPANPARARFFREMAGQQDRGDW